MWSADRHVMDVFSIDTVFTSTIQYLTVNNRKRADLVILTFFCSGAGARSPIGRLANDRPPAVGLPHFPFIQSLTISGNTVFYTKNMQCYEGLRMDIKNDCR